MGAICDDPRPSDASIIAMITGLKNETAGNSQEKARMQQEGGNDPLEKSLPLFLFFRAFSGSFPALSQFNQLTPARDRAHAKRALAVRSSA